MSGVDKDANQPKAMIHKRILESAADNPEMPMSTIAESVSGATVDLVEKVLSEYGDPGEGQGVNEPAVPTESSGSTAQVGTPDVEVSAGSNEADTASVTATTDGGGTAGTQSSAENSTTVDPEGVSESTGVDASGAPSSTAGGSDDREQHGAETMSTNGADETIIEPNDDATDDTADSSDAGGGIDDQLAAEQLSDAQLETLRAVYRQPGATQADIADALGVTRATVSRRLNDIEGFDWRSRERLAEALLPPSLKDDDSAAVGVEPNAVGVGSGSADTDSATGRTAPPGNLAALEDRLDAVEARVEEVDAPSAAGQQAEPEAQASCSDPVLDAALVHKVLVACIDSEQIDDAEEQRLVEFLLDYEPADAG